MIVPVLSQPRPDMAKDLDFFFKVSGWNYDPEQPFNPDLSLVAFYQGQIVGFITAWVDNQPYAFVDNFVIHPDFQRKGIGYHLAVAIREIVLRRGARAIRIACTNPELTAILERVGFTQRRDAVLMEWKA